jgi:hypothetical protein
MPLGAMLQSTLLIPTLAESIDPAGDKYQGWSYTKATQIPCRFYELNASNVQQPFGQELQVDAEAIVAGSQNLAPLTTGNDAGHRRQVQVINRQGVTSTWEVLRVTDLGGMGRQQKIQLKKFV